MKNKYIIFFLSILILSCEKMEYEDIDDIINPTEPTIELSRVDIDIPYTTMEYHDVKHAAMGVRNKVYYRQNNTDYILQTGGTNPNITGKLHGSPMLLKKNDGGEWEFVRTWNDIGMGGVRNTYQINANTFLFADAAEVPLNGTGIVREENHIYIAEVNGDNVNWTKIENDGYHHDASFGDLNNDGLLDILSVSQGEIYYGMGGYNFDITFDKLPSRYGTVYFSNEIVDVDNDGVKEIIESAYIGSKEDVKNGFRILKRNNEGNYELFKKNTTSQNNSKGRDVGGTWTKSLDLNNDGNQDLIILTEGCVNGTPCAGGTLETYFGDGQGNFNSNQLIDVSDLWLLTPNLLDIDFDGDNDIVFTAGSIGGDYKVSTGLRIGGGFNTGFRLDKLIYINQGNGNFEQYSKELIDYNDSYLNSFNPFINKDGKLSFYGSSVHNIEESSLSRVILWEITINNL